MEKNEHETTLADLLDAEQEALLARLLAQVMASGNGTLEIEVVQGRIQFFRPRFSYPARRNGESFTAEKGRNFEN